MIKTVLIIEDNREQAKALKQLVKEVNENTEIFMADNAADAYMLLMEKTVDVFLVDIVLDAKDPGNAAGMRFVERMRQLEKYYFAPVIFITSIEDRELHAYRNLHCFSYIEKPYDPSQVKERVEEALHYTTEREKDLTLPFKRDNILYPVKLKDVVYLESMGHVMYVHLSNRTVLEIPYKTCRGMMREEDISGRLLQCNRRTLVNREYIQGMDVTNKYLMLEENYGMLDVGGKYKKKLQMELER